MTLKELGKKIYELSYLKGDFLLRSGKRSNEYFDKYLFESDPEILKQIAIYWEKKLPSDTEVLAGLETGGIPLASSLSLKTGLPLVFVRKKAKTYGSCKLAEGLSIENKKLCIIEDVITTGGQVFSSVKELEKRSAHILKVLCVIDRGENSTSLFKEKNLSMEALFTMKDLKSFS